MSAGSQRFGLVGAAGCVTREQSTLLGYGAQREGPPMATQALGSRDCSQERLCADPFMCTDVAKGAHNRPQVHRAYHQAKALITSLATSSISSALSLTKGRGISSSESTALSPTRTSLPWAKAWSAWRTCNTCACACARCVRVLAVWAAGAVGVKPVAWCCFPGLGGAVQPRRTSSPSVASRG